MAEYRGSSNYGQRSVLYMRGFNDSINSNDPNIMSDEAGSYQEPVAVVAIDFGTTYTGYAFGLRDEKENILTANYGKRLEEDRVPTAVLLNPDKTFHSFGYQAQIYYGELSQLNKASHYYLEHFKMALYRLDRISRDSTISDARNKQINALHVFSIAIKHMYDLAFKAVKEKCISIDHRQITWILTIPAIWSDSARQFMREAATKAGIPNDQIHLVLEPEATSLFCQETESVSSRDNVRRFRVGDKYIVADLGGGTADICVHEILGDRTLRELYRATGGDLGGDAVTTAFFEFLETLFGKQSWNKFTREHQLAYFEMRKSFESDKKTFSISSNEIIKVKVKRALKKIIQTETQGSLENLINGSQYRKEISYQEADSYIAVEKNLMKEFFRPTLDGIVNKINEILYACNDPGLKTLLLVGGFSESPYLREFLQKQLHYLELILHDDTRLAVLKGAVRMGYMPRNIVQRRARYTYGFSYSPPFIDGFHPESLRFISDSEVKCHLVFHKLIEINQLLICGDTFTMKGHNTALSPEKKQKERRTRLWRSTRRDPKYCRHEAGQDDCEETGVIIRQPPPGGWPDAWESEKQLIVGETEFTVKHFNKTTGEEYGVQIDFL